MSRRRRGPDPAAKKRKQVALVVVLLIGLAVAIGTMPGDDPQDVEPSVAATTVATARSPSENTSDVAGVDANASAAADRGSPPPPEFVRRDLGWYASRSPFGRAASTGPDRSIPIAVADTVSVRAVYGSGGRHRAILAQSDDGSERESNGAAAPVWGTWDDEGRRFEPTGSVR